MTKYFQNGTITTIEIGHQEMLAIIDFIVMSIQNIDLESGSGGHDGKTRVMAPKWFKSFYERFVEVNYNDGIRNYAIDLDSIFQVPIFFECPYNRIIIYHVDGTIMPVHEYELTK